MKLFDRIIITVLTASLLLWWLFYLNFNSTAWDDRSDWLTNLQETSWFQLNTHWVAQEYIELEEDTVAMRTEEMLLRFWDYNYNEIEVIGRLHWIKTEFLVCIAKAETTLGKNMKTKWNIWNVWNTDSWWTIDYTSILRGFDAIGRTLNNKYLNEYMELRQLSRYWNKDWYIYASSEENRHLNIRNCLGMIYKDEISNAYNFRRLNTM